MTVGFLKFAARVGCSILEIEFGHYTPSVTLMTVMTVFPTPPLYRMLVEKQVITSITVTQPLYSSNSKPLLPSLRTSQAKASSWAFRLDHPSLGHGGRGGGILRGGNEWTTLT